MAVNTEGKVVGASARIKVVRFDWYSAIEREEYGSRYRYISHKKERMVFDQNGQYSCSGFSTSFIHRRNPASMRSGSAVRTLNMVSRRTSTRSDGDIPPTRRSK